MPKSPFPMRNPEGGGPAVGFRRPRRRPRPELPPAGGGIGMGGAPPPAGFSGGGSVSSRADGAAKRGRTKGRII